MNGNDGGGGGGGDGGLGQAVGGILALILTISLAAFLLVLAFSMAGCTDSSRNLTNRPITNNYYYGSGGEPKKSDPLRPEWHKAEDAPKNFISHEETAEERKERIAALRTKLYGK